MRVSKQVSRCNPEFGRFESCNRLVEGPILPIVEQLSSSQND